MSAEEKRYRVTAQLVSIHQIVVQGRDEDEAQLLKRDFPQSRSFLITMDPNESSVANKIKNGPKSGLEKVMRSNQPAFDRIIQEIKSYKVTNAPVGLFTKSNLIKFL